MRLTCPFTQGRTKPVLLLALLLCLWVCPPAAAAFDPLAAPRPATLDLSGLGVGPRPAVRMSQDGDEKSEAAWQQGMRLLQAASPEMAALVCQRGTFCSSREAGGGGILESPMAAVRGLVREMGWQAACYSYYIFHSASDPAVATALSDEYLRENYMPRDRAAFSIQPDKFAHWLMARPFRVDTKYRLWKAAFYQHYAREDWRSAVAGILQRNPNIGNLVVELTAYFHRFWKLGDFSGIDLNKFAEDAGALDKAAVSYLGVGRKWLGRVPESERRHIVVSFLRDKVWPYIQERTAEGLNIWHQANRREARRCLHRAHQALAELRRAFAARYTLEVLLQGQAGGMSAVPVSLGRFQAPSGSTGLARLEFTLFAYLQAMRPAFIRAGGGGSGFAPVSADAPRFPPGARVVRAKVFLDPRPALLRVQVLDKASGLPLEGAEVSVWLGVREKLVSRAITAADGGVSFSSRRQDRAASKGPPMGERLFVQARKKHFDEAHGYARLSPGGEASLTLSLQPWTGRAAVQVRGAADKAPLAGARVELAGRGGTLSAQTGQGGWARFDNVPEGNYRVSASKEGYQPGGLALAVDPLRPARRRLTLAPSAIRATLSAGAPARGLEGSVTLTAGARGGRAPWDYTFELTAPGGEPRLLERKSRGASCALHWDQTLTQPGRYRFRVKVRDTAGLASAWSPPVTVTVRDELAVSLSSSAPTRALEGSVEITARASGGKGPYTYRFQALDPEGAARERVRKGQPAVCVLTFGGKLEKAGGYRFRVRVSDSEGGESPWSQVVRVQVLPALAASITASAKARPLKKGRVDFTVRAQGGEPPFDYTLEVTGPKGNVATAQAKGKGAELAYPWASDVDIAGGYRFRVRVRDARGEQSPWSAAVVVTAGEPLSVRLYSDKRSRGLQGRVALRAEAFGGVEPFVYRFEITGPGPAPNATLRATTRTVVMPWASPAGVPGAYRARVRVTDSTGQQSPWSAPVGITVATEPVPAPEPAEGIQPGAYQGRVTVVSKTIWKITLPGGDIKKGKTSTEKMRVDVRLVLGADGRISGQAVWSTNSGKTRTAIEGHLAMGRAFPLTFKPSGGKPLRLMAVASGGGDALTFKVSGSAGTSTISEHTYHGTWSLARMR